MDNQDLTLRDHLASIALQVILSKIFKDSLETLSSGNAGAKGVASASYEIADAMLKERDRTSIA